MPKQFRRRRLHHTRQNHRSAAHRYLLVVLVCLIIVAFLPLLRLLVGPLAGFVWRAPEILGSRYLVLLQNEAELRPSGGFVSAFAIVDISGLSPRIEIYDSYAITPPETPIPAPEALAAVFSADPKYRGWEFRDGNFSPEFTSSAEQALAFLQQDNRFAELSFDGVVAVNFATIETLIEAFGLKDAEGASLFLTLQRETKDIDLHSREELETRKDTLAEIADRLRSKLGYFSLPKVATILAEAADRKDVQFWFADEGLADFVARKEWDGSLGDGEAFALSIANLGAKKSDRYVRRHQYSDIFVAADGSVAEHFRLEMQNSSNANLLSGNGTYVIRIIRPTGTVLIGDGDGWEQTSFAYGEEFSTQIELAPGQRLAVEARFELPFSWANGERIFDWRKQSGTEDRLFLTVHGTGETRFSTQDCDQVISREHILFCESLLTQDTRFRFALLPDGLAPILENILIQNEREVFVRFSEAITEGAPTNAVRLSCDVGEFVPEAILSNPTDLRDRTLVFPQPLTLDGEFCQFVWSDVSDLFGNTKDIRVTLPMRPPA